MKFDVNELEKRKADMMADVAALFTDASQAAMQKSIKMWSGNNLKFPEFSAIVINGGCLNFQFYLNANNVEYEITVSIWYTFGETRIGFIIPNALIENAREIATAFDGKLCQKIKRVNSVDNNQTLFDWIFTDGFANFDSAMQAMSFELGLHARRSDMVKAMISSKLADILTHLYISIATTLSHRNLAPVFFKSAPQPIGLKYKLVIAGDMSAFESFMDSREVQFLSPPTKNQNGPGMICMVSAKKGVVFSLTYHEIQDGSFSILSCDTLP